MFVRSARAVEQGRPIFRPLERPEAGTRRISRGFVRRFPPAMGDTPRRNWGRRRWQNRRRPGACPRETRPRSRRSATSCGVPPSAGSATFTANQRFRISELRPLKISVRASGRHQVALRFPQPTGHSVPSGENLGHQPPLACIRERATVGKPPFACLSRVGRPTAPSDSPGQTEVVHHSGAASAPAATVDRHA